MGTPLKSNTILVLGKFCKKKLLDLTFLLSHMKYGQKITKQLLITAVVGLLSFVEEGTML